MSEPRIDWQTILATPQAQTEGHAQLASRLTVELARPVTMQAVARARCYRGIPSGAPGGRPRLDGDGELVELRSLRLTDDEQAKLDAFAEVTETTRAGAVRKLVRACRSALTANGPARKRFDAAVRRHKAKP